MTESDAAVTPFRRRLAKVAARGSRMTAWIKTYQRCQRVISYHPSVMVPARHWFRCGLSWRLLYLAWDLDGDHFDHWTRPHEDCPGYLPCTECGGCACVDLAAASA